MFEIARKYLSKDQRRFIKFCLVGGSGVPVNLVFTWTGYNFFFSSLDENLKTAFAFVLGITVSIFSNFVLNYFWTWGDRTSGESGRFLKRLGKFYLVSSASCGVQFATAFILKTHFNIYYLLAQLTGILLGTLISFTVNHLWTFRKKN